MSIIKATIPLIVGAIGSRGLSLALRIAAAASLSISAYSEYSLKVALFITLIPLSTLSVSFGLSKLSTEKDLETLSASSTAAFYLILSLSIISTFVFYTLIPDDISKTNSAFLIACTLIGFISQGLISIGIGVNMAQLNTKRASKIELIDSTIKLIACGSVITISQLNFIDLFSVYAASSIITAIITKPQINLKLSPPKNLQPIKSLAKTCAIYSACSLTIFVFFYQAREILYSIDKTLAAQLDLAIALYSIPKMIMASIVRATIPLSNSGKYGGITKKELAVLTIICGLSSLSIFLAAKTPATQIAFELISLEKYSPALIPLSILILGAAFDLAFGIKSGILFSQNRQWITLTACIISVLALYPALRPLLSWAGLTGAATIMSATYVFLVVAIKTIETIAGKRLEDKN